MFIFSQFKGMFLVRFGHMATGLLTAWLLFFVAFPSHAQHSVGLGVGANIYFDSSPRAQDKVHIGFSSTLFHKYQFKNRFVIFNQVSFRHERRYRESEVFFYNKQTELLNYFKIDYGIGLCKTFSLSEKFTILPSLLLNMSFFYFSNRKYNDFQLVDAPNTYQEMKFGHHFRYMFLTGMVFLNYRLRDNIGIGIVPGISFVELDTKNWGDSEFKKINYINMIFSAHYLF